MADVTKKDIFDTLSEFYGKFIEPEFRAIQGRLDEHDQRSCDILDHFDQVYKKLDRPETEYYSIVAAIDKVENRLDRAEQRPGKVGDQLGTVEQKLDKEISLRQMLETEPIGSEVY